MKKAFNINLKKLKQYKPETAVVLTGIVLMLIGNIIQPAGQYNDKNTGAAPDSNQPGASYGSYNTGDTLNINGYAEYYAYQIEKLLESMEGISRAKAAVYIKDEGSGVIAENITTDESVTNETDSQGGRREEHKNVSERSVVIIKDADGNESVVYLSQSKPEIAGIAVSVKVSSGMSGMSKTLEEKIMLALMALYDIPASKISITG